MTKHFPKPPFKVQPQSIPGRSDKMEPRPDYGETTYRGSNKLKDKKAVITGADSGIGRAVSAGLRGLSQRFSKCPEAQKASAAPLT